jgi:polyhydroxyalkanoate synthase
MDKDNKEIQADFSKLYETYSTAGIEIFNKVMKESPDFINDSIETSQDYSRFFSEVSSDKEGIAKMQAYYIDFIKKQQDLFKNLAEHQVGKKPDAVINPAPEDKRFKAEEWNTLPYFDFVKQNYLLISELLTNIVSSTDVDDKLKRKIAFYTKQYIDAVSPANFFATNPEAMKLAYETKGQSLIDGFNNMMTDLKDGRINQTDTSAFELGKNLATTPGNVIFENELIQLIQYTPTTKKIYETPVLVIPPWINKYYILDLKPENSFVKFVVDSGFTTFLISWKNPTAEMRNVAFEDYVESGVLKATEVMQSITGAKKINTVGYCLGGTLQGITLAISHSRKKVPFESATFLASMIDFSDLGPMGDLIDEALVRKIEEGELKENGMMRGKVMGNAFNVIRSNDLIWNYVTNNYLKGKKLTPFDVLYWNGDNTNLPAAMYGYYLRYMLYENKLSRKNALRICDTPIDIGKIEIPTFIVGTNEDHISPAVTTFTTTELVSGPVEFVLGGSGHVMGIVNHPAKKKYGYFAGGELHKGFAEWEKTATQHEGSWWDPWTKWLKGMSGKQIDAPKTAGNTKYKVIEPAPGRYVKEKC